MKNLRVAVDIGGTFTDVVALDKLSGKTSTAKVLTTPADLTNCILDGVKRLVSDFDQLEYFVHGTTQGLNSFLERKGAKTALITTKGFKDVYEIGRASRPEMYDLYWHRPKPLVKRRDVYELNERTLFDGSISIHIDENEINELAEKIKNNSYDAVAVCFLHAYINPEHELKVEEVLKKALPNVNISLSHAVANEWREYERTSTTVLNSYIAPIMDRYLSKLETNLDQEGYHGTVHIMQSNGGIMTSHMAKKKTIQTFFSGPVGGTIGVQYLGSLLGKDNLICIDMGGTSFDVSLVINGYPDVGLEADLEGFPILTPIVNIHTIGAGGGSIAWLEAGGLRVGPHSAGADPGPACYGGGGTEATVTDANLFLGRLDDQYFLGGEMDLDVEAAISAINNLAEELQISPEEVAEGIIKIANVKMTNAIREITVQKGIDPREFTLVAFGGAGPMHAVSLAEELGIENIVVPFSPGNFSALGMLQTDIRHDLVSTYYYKMNDITASELEEAFKTIEEHGSELLREDGVKEEQATFVRTLDMRYVGQEYTVNVTLPNSVVDKESFAKVPDAFHQTHLNNYGHNNPIEDVEIVNIRVAAQGITSKADLEAASTEETITKHKPKSMKQVFFNGKYVSCPAYIYYDLPPGSQLSGPAIITENACTTVVSPGYNAVIDHYGNIVITKSNKEV